MSFIRSLALGLTAGLSAALSGDPFGGRTLLFADDFDRADSALTLGDPWVATGGSVWGIGTAAARHVSGAGTTASVDVGADNVEIEATFGPFGHQQGLCARDNGTQRVVLLVEGSAIKLYEYLAFFDEKGSFAGSFGAGDTFALKVVGDQASAYYNGTLVLTVTLTTLLTGTSHGLMGMSGGDERRWDSFKIWSA